MAAWMLVNKYANNTCTIKLYLGHTKYRGKNTQVFAPMVNLFAYLEMHKQYLNGPTRNAFIKVNAHKILASAIYFARMNTR